MVWNYKIPTAGFWATFDNGQVEADTEEVAIQLATEKILYDVEKVNDLLSYSDNTIGFSVAVDIKQIEVWKQ